MRIASIAPPPTALGAQPVERSPAKRRGDAARPPRAPRPPPARIGSLWQASRCPPSPA